MRSTVYGLLFLVAVLVGSRYLLKDVWVAQEQDGAVPEVRETRGAGVEPVTVKQEAQAHLERLTESRQGPVAVEHADHFVRRDQLLSMPDEKNVELMTLGEILSDPGTSPDNPIVILRQTEQIEISTPEEIIADAAGDLDRRIRILEDKVVKEVTVRSVLEKHAANPDLPISVVKDVEYVEKTTPKELEERGSEKLHTPLRVVRTPYRAEFATVSELLVGQKAVSSEAIVYIHTVQESDTQGIWGIVHDGLIDNFARGIAVRRGGDVDNYQVRIPRDADERLDDESSSYLGRLIDRKARKTHVYNYHRRRMGLNPDLINPGQELVIVQFSPDELIGIYSHFARKDREKLVSTDPKT